MSETPQAILATWLEAGNPTHLPRIREAIRAVLARLAAFEAGQKPLEGDSRSRVLRRLGVADADEALEKIDRLYMAEAENSGYRARLAQAEAERDALATNVRMAGRSAEHAKAERDALRAKCGDLGASVNIMGKVAVNLGQAKQIAESTLVELQRDDDHDQALLIEALSRLEDERDALRDSYDAAAAAWGRDEQEYLQEVERLRGLLTEWIPRHSAACCTPTPEIGTFPPGPFLPKWCCCDDLSKRSRSALEEKP